MLERFSGNRVCLKDGEIEECSKDDGQRRTGLHFREDGNSSTRTTAYCFLKCSLVWLPLLPSSSSLSAYKQWFVCLPVAFWFQHQEPEPQRAMCMHLCMCLSMSIPKSVCRWIPTQKHDRVSISFSVFTHVTEFETVFHLQNTLQHHRMSHPFHLLPLLSVTPASTPCLMDFQMQVHDFFQDLTGIFLCV